MLRRNQQESRDSGASGSACLPFDRVASHLLDMSASSKAASTFPPPSSLAADAVAIEREGLLALESALRGPLAEPFRRATELLLAAHGRVIVSGMGKSGHIGRKIAATFASTGTPAHFVHPAEASHGDLGMIRSDDAIIALSWSGETPELRDLLVYAKRFGVPLIAVTSRADSALALAADAALILPSSVEACPNHLAPTTSTTMMLAAGDALAVVLLKIRGFSAADFRVYHPGGKLGSQLRHVGEIARPLETLVCADEHQTVGEVLIEITRLATGYALVTGPGDILLGIVTDGDIRRHVSPDLVTRSVGEIMTRNPKVVHVDMLAAEALKILNDLRVTAAPVLRGGRLVGGIHLNDLIATGVA